MAPFVCSWGIVGCGKISGLFVQDLCLSRVDVTDVVHSIAAVGSRDKIKAEGFIQDQCPKGASAQQQGLVSKKPEACGSYEEVYTHSDVNVVYIGTLNPAHYTDAVNAVNSGKNVLVEKPGCLNAAEWKALSGLAKQKGVFLMEGVWTRFLPLSFTLQDKLFKEKVIGDIKSVHADFSMAFYNNRPDTARNIALETAGGPLFDLGPYIILMAVLTLYHHPVNAKSPPENIMGSMIKARTGVDLTTRITMDFPKLEASAVLCTSTAYNSPRDQPCTIIGTRGEIVIHDGLSRITKMTIKRYGDDEGMFFVKKWKDDEVIEQGFPGFGLHFEADAVARSIRDGEQENSRCPHDESLMVMEIIDEVRRQGGYVLPDGLEKVT